MSAYGRTSLGIVAVLALLLTGCADKRKTSHASVVALIAYRGGTFADEHADDMAALDVVDTIISGWLHTHLRGERDGLAYAVQAFNRPGLVPRIFGAYANCQPDKVNRVSKIMQDDLAKAARGEFTQDELQEAKRQIVTSEKMSTDTVAQMAQRRAVNAALGRPSDWDSPQNIERRIESVTTDDLRRVAGKCHLVAVVVTPEPAGVDVGIDPTIIEEQPPATVPASAAK